MHEEFLTEDCKSDALIVDACINATDWLPPAEAMKAKAYVGLSEEDVALVDPQASEGPKLRWVE